MTVLLAVAVAGGGSLLLRVLPLLGARRLPDRVTRSAAWAGLGALAALTTRAVATHRAAGLPAAPGVAAVAVATGLVLAYRGRSVLLAVAAGAAVYVLLSAALTAF